MMVPGIAATEVKDAVMARQMATRGDETVIMLAAVMAGTSTAVMPLNPVAAIASGPIVAAIVLPGSGISRN